VAKPCCRGTAGVGGPDRWTDLGTLGLGHTLLLLSAGAVTSVPLLFFGAAARRLPLSIMGLMQYIAPVMQFAFWGVHHGRTDASGAVDWLRSWCGLRWSFLSIDALTSRRNRLLAADPNSLKRAH